MAAVCDPTVPSGSTGKLVKMLIGEGISTSSKPKPAITFCRFSWQDGCHPSNPSSANRVGSQAAAIMSWLPGVSS